MGLTGYSSAQHHNQQQQQQQQQQQLQLLQGWQQQQQQQQGWCPGQGQGVDEFGVSMQPSLSDDESETNDVTGRQRAALQQAGVQQQQLQPQLQAQPQARVQQLHQMLLPPGRGPGPAAAAAAVAGGLLPGADGSASADDQMGAFLGSRKREFAVPRMGKPVASRQLTPQHQQQQQLRGAGQLMAVPGAE